MSDSRAGAPSGLWAITSYFNPLGYQTRLANYRIFRRHLPVPLLTVELGYDGRFELNARDATTLVQVPGGDVMWQKERLLNLGLDALPPACDVVVWRGADLLSERAGLLGRGVDALDALPPECDVVVWLDADILFDRADWPERAVEALDASVMVQLFSRTCYLPREVDFSRPLAEQRYLQRRSTASGLVGGVLQENTLSTSLEVLKAHGMALDYSNGHAWAMRRDLLQTAGFYEAMIVGGGDYVFLQAALGQFEAVRKGHGWTVDSLQYRHYLRWAERFHTVVRGRIGMVPGDIFNLWHGELLDRRYMPRHEILVSHDFDPDRDTAIDEHGSLRWNTDNPALHAAVRDYFRGRQEDGRHDQGPAAT